jgi:hypothetical protein
VLVDRHGAHVRGIAKLLGPVERVSPVGRRRAVDDHHLAAGLRHRFISFRTASGSRKWWNAKREVTIENDASGNGSGSTSPCFHVMLVSPWAAWFFRGLLQHRRREIDAGGVTHGLGEGADDETAAAGDVEHRVVGAGPAELHDEAQRRLVLDGRRRTEGHRLTRELVENRVLMVVIGRLLTRTVRLWQASRRRYPAIGTVSDLRHVWPG